MLKVWSATQVNSVKFNVKNFYLYSPSEMKSIQSISKASLKHISSYNRQGQTEKYFVKTERYMNTGFIALVSLGLGSNNIIIVKDIEILTWRNQYSKMWINHPPMTQTYKSYRPFLHKVQELGIVDIKLYGSVRGNTMKILKPPISWIIPCVCYRLLTSSNLNKCGNFFIISIIIPYFSFLPLTPNYLFPYLRLLSSQVTRCNQMSQVSTQSRLVKADHCLLT